MRRHTFLTVTGACLTTTLLPALGACSESWRSVKRPPSDDALPSAFSERPVWPDLDAARTELKATRGRYLCGGATADKAQKIFTDGWCPVIVDVSTLTTRAVLQDDNGDWRTEETELIRDTRKERNTALTTSVLGPALLDENHAYLVVGTINLSSPAQPGSSSSSEMERSTQIDSVVMLKVGLGDGAVPASAVVCRNVPLEDTWPMNLSFSSDRSALLLAGQKTGDQGDYIGLRLSADDLSTQFDAHSILDGKEITKVFPGGQAVVTRHDPAPSREEIVFLADGAHEPLDENYPYLVRDGWYYYKYGEGGDSEALSRARNLSTGDVIELEDGWDLADSKHTWPDVTAGQQTILTVGWDSTALSVRQPGAPAPALRWTEFERPAPKSASSLDDVIYTINDTNDPKAKFTYRLDIISATTGENLVQESQSTKMSSIDAVTPWGAVTYGRFHSATAWLDS